MTRSRKSNCSGLDSDYRGNSSCNKIRFRKRQDVLHRIQSKKSLNVAEVVYGFLGNIAIINAEQRRFHCNRYRIRRAGLLRRDRLMHKESQKCKNGISRNYSGTALKTRHKYAKKLQRNINAKNASRPLTIDTHVSPRNRNTIVPKSLSWISDIITRLNKRPSFIQVTNNYIKTRVGTALSNFQSAHGKDDESSRSQRRKLRRGDANCNSLDRKSLRRGISPWFTFNQRRKREDKAIVTKKMGEIDNNRKVASSSKNSTETSNRSATYIERKKRNAKKHIANEKEEYKKHMKNVVTMPTERLTGEDDLTTIADENE